MNNVIGNFEIVEPKKIRQMVAKVAKGATKLQDDVATAIPHAFGHYMLHHNDVALVNSLSDAIVKAYGNGTRFAAFKALILDHSTLTWNSDEKCFKHSKNKLKKGKVNRFSDLHMQCENWWQYASPDADNDNIKMVSMKDLVENFCKRLETRATKRADIQDFDPELLNMLRSRAKAAITDFHNQRELEASREQEYGY